VVVLNIASHYCQCKVDIVTKGLDRIRTTKGLALKIAKGLKITRSSVSQWTRVPAERIVEVERITGIPREELRPDLYRKSSRDRPT